MFRKIEKLPLHYSLCFGYLSAKVLFFFEINDAKYPFFFLEILELKQHLCVNLSAC